MTNWPLGFGAAKTEEIAVNAAISAGVDVLSSATANTKGAWTQLVDGGLGLPAFDEIFLLVRTETNVNYAMDISIGASGAEHIICLNLFIPVTNSPSGAISVSLPISIPGSTRIAVRTQADGSNAQKRVDVVMLGTAGGELYPPGFSGMESMGFISATTKGTPVNAGATAHTKGGWTEIKASTPSEYAGLFIFMQADRHPTAGTVAVQFLIDVGVGAAGAEQVILSNIVFRNTTVGAGGNPRAQGPFWTNVPMSSRVAVRVQCDQTNAVDRILGVVLSGIVK